MQSTSKPVSVTDTGSDTEVSEKTVSLFDSLRILELRLETGGEQNNFGGSTWIGLEGNQSLCLPQERREMELGEQDCQEHTPQREDS